MKTTQIILTSLLACSISICPNLISQSHATKRVANLTPEKTPEEYLAVSNENERNNSSTMSQSFGSQPLFFIQNDGQLDEKIKYFEKGASHATYFAQDGIYLSLFKQQRQSNQTTLPEEKNSAVFQSDHLRLSFVNADPNPQITAEGLLQTKFNYFIGNDPDKWRTEVPTYNTVSYKEIYTNIDLKIYGNDQQLEYDVIVNPGGDPEVVKFKYEGANSLTINEQGELEIELNNGTLTQRAPYLYQEVDGQRIEISGSFKLLADNSYTFAVDSYDTDKQLVIDPVIEYSGYLGGNWKDIGNAIAVDSQGNAYITGSTLSSTFPGSVYTLGSLRNIAAYHFDVFVTKLDSTGTILYSTILGGTANDEISGAYVEAGYGIAVDSSGNAHITGGTRSKNFPVTTGAFQPIHGGNNLTGEIYTDAFYVVLNPAGTRVYSSFLGGRNNDGGTSIAVDNSGNAYIGGWTAPYDYRYSSSFPIAGNDILQSTYGGDNDSTDSYAPADGFITKIHFDAVTPANTSVVFSTYFGGTGTDNIRGIALDSSQNIYVTGETRSDNLPGASTSTIQSTFGGGADAFVAKINAAGTTIVYSTYLGGSGPDYGLGIDVDPMGSAYITGYIYVGAYAYNFPLVNPIQNETSGGEDAFVTKLNANGSSIVYSTFLGGSGGDRGNGISVDSLGTAYITGYTRSDNFPIHNPINGHDVIQGGNDAFITRLNPSGTAYLYSTFYGGTGTADSAYGIAVDDNGNAYITGITNSTCLPAPEEVEGVPKCITGYSSYQDGYITKIYDSAPIPPEVVSVLPSDGDIDVAIDTIITATFSKDMNTTSFAGNFTLLDGVTPVAGTVGSSDAQTITFTPSSPLTEGTLYTATLTTAIQAIDGSFLDFDFTWQFTVIPPVADLTPPTVVASTPIDKEESVAIDTVIIVTFSENIAVATLNTSSFYLLTIDSNYNTITITGSVSYNPATKTATFTPDSDLPYGTWINVYIENTVTDLAGNPLSAAPSWWSPENGPYNGPYETQFHTACDPSGPTVVSSSPTWAAIDVPVNPTISFTFDQDFDPATVNPNAAELCPSDWSVKIPISISYDVTTRTLSFTPDTPLENGSSYYAIVSSSIFFTLKGGKLCTNPFVMFTTIAAGDPCSSDTTSPIISATADVTTNCTGLGGTAVALETPAVTDTCDTNPTLVNDAPDLFPVGTTTVTWTAMDASGNSNTASQDVIIADPQNFCAGPPLLVSPFSDEPPIMDGVLDFGEWSAETTNQINLKNGFIRVTNDTSRLYILIDLLADDGDDVDAPRDFFNITFDINNDGLITADTDINYTLFPDVANIRYQLYTGADSWSGWQPETFSSMARGFDCFLGDGSKTFTAGLLTDTCNLHRVWEIAIDLQEIGAIQGDTISMGIQVASPNPAFIEDFPAPFTSDFANLLEIQLAHKPPNGDDLIAGSVSLETDAIEITQAIQDRQNTLPLVQDKDTAARVYVVADQGALSRTICQVSLYAQKAGVDLPGSPLTKLHAAPMEITRESLYSPAPFLLPKSWTQGDVTFYSVVRGVNPGDLGDRSQPLPLTFTPKRIPTYWSMLLNSGTDDIPVVEDLDVMTGLENYTKATFPVADINFIRKPWQGVGTTTRDDAIADLQDYYSQVQISWGIGVIATGSAPFELPDQIFGTTVFAGGLSDPKWIPGGLGIVAWGGVFAGSGNAVMAHEINHNLGPGDCRDRVDDNMLDDMWGRHVSDRLATASNPAKPWRECIPGDTGFTYGCNAGGPDPEWQELFDDDEIGEVGFDTRLPWVWNGVNIVEGNAPDFMSYCLLGTAPEKWISTYRWERMFDHFETIVPANGMTPASISALDIAEVYYISGQVNLDGTGNLKPLIATQGIPHLPQNVGQHSIEFLDDQGGIIQTHSFYASFTDMETEEQRDTVPFNFQIPVILSPAVAKINLLTNSQIIDSIVVSVNPPQVSILSPNGGESWSGSGTVTWEGVDDDNDPLTYALHYSPDNGNLWVPITRNLITTSYTVDTSLIPGGANALFKAIATDGFHTAMDDSDAPFTVLQNPPTVTLVEPSDGIFFAAGTKMTLRGQATDPEDEILANAAFVWTLNGQAIAVGRKAIVSLPVGLHELILRVTDSAGAYSEISIIIEGLTCLGDYNGDGDVDGLDIVDQATGFAGISLKNFAGNFGTIGCQ